MYTKRLVYTKVYHYDVETIHIPILHDSEIALKANIIATICEYVNTTHNFGLEVFNEETKEWDQSFIPQSELNKIT